MAKNDLQTAKQNWAQRIDQARAAGLPDSAFTGLMQRDLTAVNQGKTPMQNKEVIDAMRASAGLSPIKDPSYGHSLLDTIGNVASDVRGIVTGFPGGVVNYVTTLPEQMANLKDLVQQDPQTIKELGLESGSSLTDVGGLLRNMSKIPVLSPLVPGVHTAAAATTPEGRKELEQHPVSTVIDVAAAASAAGKLGAFGKATGAEETAALKEARAIEDPAKRMEAMQSAPRTVKGALQSGNPYKALGRGAIKVAESTPKVREHINSRTIRQVAMDLAFHPDLTENLAGARGRIQTRQELEMRSWMKEHIIKPYKGLKQDQRELLARVAQETATPEEVAQVAGDARLSGLIADARTLQDEAAKLDPNQVIVKAPWQRKYVYAKGSPVANKWQKHQKLAKKAVEAEKAMNELESIAHDKINRFPGEKNTYAAVARAMDARTHFEKMDKAAGAALKTFHETLGQHAPASFYAKIAEQVRTKAIDVVTHNTKLSEAQVAEAIDHVKASVDFSDLAAAFGGGDKGMAIAEGIYKEAEQQWTEMARNGANPIFLPNVTGSKLNRVYQPSVIPDARYAKAHTSKQTAFNLSRSVQDITVGLSKTHANMLTEAGTREFVDKHVKPFAKTTTAIHTDIRHAVANGGFNGADIREVIKDETKRHWRAWDPTRFGLTQHFPSPEGGEMMVPLGVERSLRYLGFSEHSNPFFTAYDRAMNVWRFAVLSTPRHIAHVLLGGLVMGELQDPTFLRDTKGAIDIMRAHDPTLISKFGKANDFNPEQLLLHGGGFHMGRILTAVTGSTAWLKNMEDNATIMYKISYMLHQERKGATRDEAIRLANKVFVDANAMSPLERGIFRKVFPFWGFTRHLFRYLMTYPVDHPYRAAILTNLANQHYADWQSGLPQQLQFMFFLGAPDANGNVNAVDYRSIDPFRSFYNDFTIAGLTQQANPAFQMIMQQAGVNVLSATPELYPGTHYDPNTGTMVADRQSNPLLAALEIAVPETQGADALFQMSDQYRNLKTTDPEAFKHRVYTTLGIPFGPETINIPTKIENAQMKRYKDAQTSIGQAIQTGDFSKAKRYASVPVPSSFQRYFGNLQYATPGQIEQIYRALKAQAASQGLGGTSLHALLPKG